VLRGLQLCFWAQDPIRPIYGPKMRPTSTTPSPTTCLVECLNGRRTSETWPPCAGLAPTMAGLSCRVPCTLAHNFGEAECRSHSPSPLLAPLALSFAISAPEHGRRSHGRLPSSMAASTALSCPTPFSSLTRRSHHRLLLGLPMP
jgi:hypothetical protein